MIFDRFLSTVAGCAVFALISLLAYNQPIHGAELSEPIYPLIKKKDLNQDKVELGRLLFHDKQLSSDNSISCASCHEINKGGADQVRYSKGVGGATGIINAPTVLNSSLNFRQFWDGRAATLNDQIDGPLHEKHEMDSNWQQVIVKLEKDHAYKKYFDQIYDDGIKSANIKDAIATYESSLITPSRFDRYLLGDKSALNQDEIKGYELFKNYGCVACHQGVNVGGNMYQIFGVMGDYFKDRGNITEADYGLFNVTKNEQDRYKFKVPTLRNIAMTAPYFHDGTAKTLHDAVKVMAKYQLGRNISMNDEELIIKFLNTLSGKVDKQNNGEKK
ncbi:MAG: cytochrome-c peroxidase [Ignavibacteriae bacterium]|nr:cytochrome-c peroxidase [Ignavibacteriota bacterium]